MSSFFDLSITSLMVKQVVKIGDGKEMRNSRKSGSIPHERGRGRGMLT